MKQIPDREAIFNARSTVEASAGRGWVYVLWWNEELIYVGKTTNLSRRLGAHNFGDVDHQSNHPFTHYAAFEYPLATLHLWELRFMEELQPSLNNIKGSSWIHEFKLCVKLKITSRQELLEKAGEPHKPDGHYCRIELWEKGVRV